MMTHWCFSERLEVDLHDVGDLLPGRVELVQDEVPAVGTQDLVVDLDANAVRLK